MRLVDHKAGTVAAAELDDLRERSDVALHREHTVDDHEHAPSVLRRAFERPLELVHPVVTEGPELCPREDAAVEDRGVVARVRDDRVAGLEDGAEAAQVGLVAGREHEGRLRVHPLGELLLELEMEQRRAVQESRAGHPGAVPVQGVVRGADDPLVAGQAEVVVGAEHHALGALHVHDRPRRAAQRSPVRDDVGLARRAQDLRALVIAGLGEDVDGGRHVGCRGHARRGPPRRVQTRAEGVHEAAVAPLS